MFIIQLFVFIFGLIAGSFLNVLISRLPHDESIMGRSHCPKCRHILCWPELVPVFSFIFLGAKCRYCKEKISWQYPIIEIITGLLFLLIYNVCNLEFGIWNLSGIWDLGFGIFITSCLIVIFVSDLKYYIIPDQIIYIAVIIAFLFGIWNFGIWDLFGNWKLEIGNLRHLIPYLLPAIGASGFFLSLVLISRGAWMGMGDVKLAFLMGLILGWPNILIALFLSFFTGAIVGIVLILLGKKGWKSEIPFGTFLAVNTFLVLLWGDYLLRYL